MASVERTPREKETLMFSGAEQAGRFVEKIENRVQQIKQPGIRRDQEVVAQAVADEMEEQGEYPEILRQPWMHTNAEHQEVQRLVDVTFSEDLSVALRKARSSDSYPRNIDLLHDVLTMQLYEVLTEKGANKQGVPGWVWGTLGSGAIILGVLMVWLIFA